MLIVAPTRDRVVPEHINQLCKDLEKQNPRVSYSALRGHVSRYAEKARSLNNGQLTADDTDRMEVMLHEHVDTVLRRKEVVVMK